jgi:hypothetical protein
MKEKLDHWIGTDINYLFLHPQKAIYIVFCYGFPLNICHISETHIRILYSGHDFWYYNSTLEKCSLLLAPSSRTPR